MPGHEPARRPAGTPASTPAAGGGNGLRPANGNGGEEDLPPFGADVRNALRTRAERIPLRALERRGFRSVQVLDMATIEKIVAEAVTHCLERHTGAVTSEDRVRLEAEARREFAKLLAEHKRVVAEKSDAERRKEELDRQVQGLREELARHKVDLHRERNREFAETTFTLSPAAFKEMEEKIRHLFEQLLSKERRLSLAEAGPRALKGLSELEREVAAFLDRLLVTERERFLGSVRKDHSQRVEILEKRIGKLNKALAETEDALRRVAEAKAEDPGIASIYDSIQGLSPRDPLYRRKRELLELVFKDNLVIQKVAIAPETALAAAPRAPVTLDPQPPLGPITDEPAF